MVDNDSTRLLESHLSIAVHPLLNHLVKSKRFWSSLEKASHSTIEGNNLLDLYRLLGLLLTPSYQSNLCENISFYQLLELFLYTTDRGKISLVKLFAWQNNNEFLYAYNLLNAAHVEFNRAILVNGVIHSGRSAYLVPLYELLVTQACSGVAICQSAAIISCTTLLLKFVCHRGIWAFLVASDILCFMARYHFKNFELHMVLITVNHLKIWLCPVLSGTGAIMFPVDAFDK